MDIPLLILVVASMVFVYFLARERGRRPSRWVAAASIVGPFAISALYLAEAGSALRKMMSARRS
jgi:formate hydrogenlyase subunit 3/multisubunit Na+/H+ antiporter MnhD subunit